MHFLVYVLFLHYVGDFFCQTNWMAVNKSKSQLALSVQVLVYTAVLLFGLHLALLFHPVRHFGLYCLINGSLHFGIDFVTSRLTSRFWEKRRTYSWWTLLASQGDCPDSSQKCRSMPYSTRFHVGLSSPSQ